MIPAAFYPYIFLILVAIMTLVAAQNKRDVYDVEPLGPSLIVCILCIVFIGTRPHSAVFGDTINYSNWWGLKIWMGFDPTTENKLFDNLYNWMGSIFPDPTVFFIFIATLFFGGVWVASRKLFPANTLIVFLAYMAAFSTFSYATNGIKAGAASTLFLISMAYRDKLPISIIFLLLSWGFHHSMQVPVAAYVLTLFFKDCKWYFYGWLFCLLMALGHVTVFQEIFAGMSEENGYLTSTSSADWGGKSGFRIDFVLYSAMPVVMGYYVLYKYKLQDRLYEIMLQLYLVTNAIWMLCMYAEYTNRIAYLSWCMYPFLIIWPCFAIPDESHPLVENRFKYIYAHLGFTLFMELIYYA